MIAPFNAATALTAGFIAVPRTTKSFTHPRYPGLLFRLVSSTSEAVSVGGVLCSSDNGLTQVLSFGLTAVWAVGKGLEGSIFSPGSFVRLIDRLGPKRSYRNRVVNSTVYPHEFVNRQLVDLESTQVLMTSAKQRTLLIDYKYMGIVSKCDRGHVFVRPDVVSYEDIAIPPDATKPNTVMPENDGVRVGLPSCGGFLNISWKIDKKQYLLKAKDGFLQSLPSGSVRDSYSNELSKIIEAETGSVEDGILLHAAYVAGVVRFTHETVTDSTLRTNYDPYINGGVAALFGYARTTTYDGIDEKANFDTGPNEYTMRMCGNYTGTLADGRPFVKHILAHREQGSNYTANYVPSFSPMYEKVYVFASSFPMDRAPYEFVEMEKNIKLKAGNVLSVVSPLAAPMLPIVSGSTLDLTGRIENDLVAIGSSSQQTPLFLDDSVTQTQGAVLIAAGRLSERDRQSNLDKLIPMARPFTRFILSTVNRLDKAVSAL